MALLRTRRASRGEQSRRARERRVEEGRSVVRQTLNPLRGKGVGQQQRPAGPAVAGGGASRLGRNGVRR